MKEYTLNMMERCFQFEMVIVAPTMKLAAQLMNTTVYQIRTYGSAKKPTTIEAIKDPLTRFVIFPQFGGELWSEFPKKRGKIMKYIHFQSFVGEYINSKQENEKSYIKAQTPRYGII